MRSSTSSTVTALIGGVLGGIAGTAAMAAIDAAWSAVDHSNGPVARSRRLRRSGVGAGALPQSEPRSHEGEDTPSEAIARRLPGVTTRRRERAVGSLVHFAFGATAGAGYAALLATAPPHIARLLRSGHGVTYGTLVWLLADEIGVPLARLAPPPHRTSLRMHAYALAGHVGYGLALESVRRIVTSSTRLRSA